MLYCSENSFTFVEIFTATRMAGGLIALQFAVVSMTPKNRTIFKLYSNNKNIPTSTQTIPYITMGMVVDSAWDQDSYKMDQRFSLLRIRNHCTFYQKTLVLEIVTLLKFISKGTWIWIRSTTMWILYLFLVIHSIGVRGLNFIHWREEKYVHGMRPKGRPNHADPCAPQHVEQQK